MGAGFISYNVDNDNLFRDAIKRASGIIADFRIPFQLIANDFYRSEQSIFQLKSEGQYPAISKKYGETKQKKYGFQYPLLVRKGRLADSLSSGDGGESLLEITPTSLTIGTKTPYGVYHQSDRPRKIIPLRKFLFIGPEAPAFANSDQAGRTQRWLNIINDFALKKLKKSGGGFANG